MEQAKWLNLYDYIIQGTDRNPGNYLLKDGKWMAIDHSWAFRQWDLYHNHIKFGDIWNIDGKNVLNFIPNDKAFFEKLSKISDKKIYNHMIKYVSLIEANNIVARKKEFVRKVNKRIKELGEDVIFPAK